jgi:putative DNA primase/helicase
VTRYLAGRGITTNPPPPSLRWAPRCPHPSGVYLPAMVAKVVNIDGDLIGVHRTFLQPDGSGKADIETQKGSLGPISSGAVRLAPAAKTVLIGEGIETCMAALQATAMPTWAALSTAGMVALRLPLIARDIIILADHDANGAGERAAYAAADRWLAEGRRVRIALPPVPGTDFADVLLGRAYARIAETRDVAA